MFTARYGLGLCIQFRLIFAIKALIVKNLQDSLQGTFGIKPSIICPVIFFQIFFVAVMNI